MEEEINLFEYYYIVKKKFWFIVIFILLFSGLVGVGLIIWPKTYKSEAILLPVSVDKTSQFSSLAGLSGLSGLLDQGSKTLNQLTVFLESRSLAQRVIEKNSFSDRIIKTQKIKQGQEPIHIEVLANYVLKKIITVKQDVKKGVVQFSILTKDPNLSYDLMNGYLRELKEFVNDNHITSAKKNREFIGNQLLEAQKELLEAGKNISNYYSQYKVSSLSSKIDVTVFLPLSKDSTNEDDAVLDFSMDQRKELIESLVDKKEEVKKITQLYVKDVPQQNYLEYLTLQKNLLIKLQMLLSEQYEMARLDEAKESLSFQIVDGPVFTKRPFSPRVKIVLIAGFMASIILGFLVVIFMHYIKVAKAQYDAKNKTGFI